jgi:hypothetical protein
MPISWLPGHITHVIVASVYAIATVSLTALEVYFIKSVTSTEVFFFVLQNVGIMGTSGYFASKINVTPTGLTESNKGA